MTQADFFAQVNSRVVSLTHQFSFQSLDKDKLITLVRFILFNDFLDLFNSRVDASISSNQRDLLRKYESEQNWVAYYDLINKEFDMGKVLNAVNDNFERRLSGLIAAINKS